jgi:hypothetical protein
MSIVDRFWAWANRVGLVLSGPGHVKYRNREKMQALLRRFT